MEVKSLSLSQTHISITGLRPRLVASCSIAFPFSLPLATLRKTHFPISHLLQPYPLQHDMIINRLPRVSGLGSDNSSESEKPGVELSLDGWVDHKLASQKELDRPMLGIGEMDESQKKYYNKRRKRVYGSDSDDGGRSGEGSVELRPEVVEFDRLHKREEELYFHDAFSYPWEKEKHCDMVCELEKKYFPDQGLDKAFLEPGASNEDANVSIEGKVKKLGNVFGDGRGRGGDEGLLFFEEGGGEIGKKDLSTSVTENKGGQLSKCLKKVPNEDNQTSDREPYLLTRSTELPPRWDSPFGTVVLVNKPKGWTSFTVCGKLRHLVKVKKVGHAGTLDPMATGLLIVCVGKATKLADSYQGMIKGYSGVFRLGEATSTWDADSAVIQREPWEHIKDEDIKKAVESFMGEIWQVPPMFSAIKVKGEKMYDKARRGESIELAPRRISIFEFDIERSMDDRQNLIFRVVCSKGTYIRSLCSDLGKALGSCAHLTALRRDSIGEYSADDAWNFSELQEAIMKL